MIVHSTFSLAKAAHYFLRKDDERHEAFEEKLFTFSKKNATKIFRLLLHFVFLLFKRLSVNDEKTTEHVVEERVQSVWCVQGSRPGLQSHRRSDLVKHLTVHAALCQDDGTGGKENALLTFISR